MSDKKNLKNYTTTLKYIDIKPACIRNQWPQYSGKLQIQFHEMHILKKFFDEKLIKLLLDFILLLLWLIKIILPPRNILTSHVHRYFSIVQINVMKVADKLSPGLLIFVLYNDGSQFHCLSKPSHNVLPIWRQVFGRFLVAYQPEQKIILKKLSINKY